MLKAMRKFLKRAAAVLVKLIPDALYVAGCACITTGAAVLHPAAGWLAAGILLIAAFVLWSLGGSRP